MVLIFPRPQNVSFVDSSDVRGTNKQIDYYKQDCHHTSQPQYSFTYKCMPNVDCRYGEADVREHN
jgi:hypothetical protein